MNCHIEITHVLFVSDLDHPANCSLEIHRGNLAKTRKITYRQLSQFSERINRHLTPITVDSWFNGLYYIQALYF